MNAPIDEIESEIEHLEELAEEIEELYTEFFNNIEIKRGGNSIPGGGVPVWEIPSGKEEELQREALEKYEKWYTSAHTLISKYLPERTGEFEEQYQGFKKRICLEESARLGVLQSQNTDFYSQRGVLKSVPDRVRLRELEVRRQISQNVAQTEIDKAHELLDEGETRASGVVAGIALERYLLMRCENADEEIEYDYKDGIDALAQKLFNADVINKSPYQHLKHLSSIRADCAHANEEDPDEEDVKRLLEDAEDYVRGRKI